MSLTINEIIAVKTYADYRLLLQSLSTAISQFDEMVQRRLEIIDVGRVSGHGFNRSLNSFFSFFRKLTSDAHFRQGRF